MNDTTRCEDFYKKWEDNPNWCEKCDETVRRIDLYVTLVKEHPPIGGISEGAARPLLRLQEGRYKDRAISHVEHALNQINPKTGRSQKLTAKDVEYHIESAGIELRNEVMAEVMAAERAEEERTGIHKITQEEVDEPLDQPDQRTEEEVDAEILAEDVRLREQEPSEVYTVTQDEIDAYFAMMTKIGCTGDMPRHQSRINRMIADKTLIIG